MQMALGVDGRGGRRAGAGKPAGTKAVPLDIRERLVTAKAEKEEQLARLAALEVAETEGRLISSAEASLGSARAAMQTRDAVLAIPARYAAELAACDDEREIIRILTDALRAEFTRLADLAPKNAGGRDL